MPPIDLPTLSPTFSASALSPICDPSTFSRRIIDCALGDFAKTLPKDGNPYATKSSFSTCVRSLTQDLNSAFCQLSGYASFSDGTTFKKSWNSYVVRTKRLDPNKLKLVETWAARTPPEEFILNLLTYSNDVVTTALKQSPHLLLDMPLPKMLDDRLLAWKKIYNFLSETEKLNHPNDRETFFRYTIVTLKNRLFLGATVSKDTLNNIVAKAPLHLIDILNFSPLLAANGTFDRFEDFQAFLSLIEAHKHLLALSGLKNDAAVTLLQAQPHFLDELLQLEDKQLYKSVKQMSLFDPHALTELLKYQKFRDFVERHRKSKWLTKQLNQIRQATNQPALLEQKILIFTECMGGYGDFQAALKLIRNMRTGHSLWPIVWFIVGDSHIGTNTTRQLLQEELSKNNKLIVILASDTSLLPTSEEYQALQDAALCISFPANKDSSLFLSLLDKIPKCGRDRYLLTEYDRTTSQLMLKQTGLTPQTLRTGVSDSALGVLIESTPPHSFEHEIFAFLGLDNKTGIVKAHNVLYSGYASTAFDTRILATYFATVLKLENDKKRDIDIIIPFSKDLHPVLTKAFLSAHGVSTVEIYFKNLQKQKTISTGLTSGKRIRFLDVFPLPTPAFNGIIHLSEPFGLATGDQSFVEMATMPKHVMPFYQLLHWKFAFYESLIKLAEQQGWTTLVHFLNVNKAIDRGFEWQSEVLSGLIQRNDFKKESAAFAKFLREEKNLGTNFARLLPKLMQETLCRVRPTAQDCNSALHPPKLGRTTSALEAAAETLPTWYARLFKPGNPDADDIPVTTQELGVQAV